MFNCAYHISANANWAIESSEINGFSLLETVAWNDFSSIHNVNKCLMSKKLGLKSFRSLLADIKTTLLVKESTKRKGGQRETGESYQF